MDADALPAELWILILEWAVFVPNLNTLSPDIATINMMCTSHHVLNQPLYDSMLIKCTLVLVCKQWSAWTLPMLYEHISIAQRPRLEVLEQVLSRSALASEAAFYRYQNQHGDGGRPDADDDVNGSVTQAPGELTRRTLGSYVKRLDISLDMVGRNYEHVLIDELGESGDTVLCNRLTRVINCTRNLQHIVFATSGAMLLGMSASMVTSLMCCHELRSLVWYTAGLYPSESDLRKLLTSLPNLEVLTAPSYYEEPPPYHPNLQDSQSPSDSEGGGGGGKEADKIHLGSLSTLYVSPIYLRGTLALSADTLSGLTQAAFSDIFLPMNFLPMDFLRDHGARLQHIQFFETGADCTRLQALLAALPVCCPALVRLDIYPTSWGALAPIARHGLHIPPSILTLGLAVRQGNLRVSKAVGEVVGALIQGGETLRRLKLLSARTIQALVHDSPESLKVILEVARTKGIRVEDKWGREVEFT